MFECVKFEYTLMIMGWGRVEWLGMVVEIRITLF